MLQRIKVVSGLALLKDVETQLDEELKSSPLARQLLTAQIDIIRSRSDFAGLDISKVPKSKIAGYFDRGTKQLHLILGSKNPVSTTVSHEIVHTIEFLDAIKSEEKVDTMLRSVNLTQYNKVAQNLLAGHLKEEFRRQISSGGNTQEKFYQEIGSYVFEGLFFDIKKHGEQGVANFKSRFGDFVQEKDIEQDTQDKKPNRKEPTYEDKILKSQVQEIIAVSIYDVNQVIINSLTSTDQMELKQHLINANSVLKPAYEAAKTHHPGLWPQSADTQEITAHENTAAHTQTPNVLHAADQVSIEQKTSPTESSTSSPRSESPAAKRFCSESVLEAAKTITSSIPDGTIVAASNNDAATPPTVTPPLSPTHKDKDQQVGGPPS